MTSTEMRFFWLLLSIMKCSKVPFTDIYEWKRCSPSSISSGSPGWSLVVEMVALGSASMICLPLSSSGSESESASDSKAFSSTTNDYFERQSIVLCQGGSYGSRTTSWYLSLSFQCPSLLASWIGSLDIVHIFSVLCSMGWGCPFLAFVVRGSQAQIATSFI
jgi:hypothetical protein